MSGIADQYEIEPVVSYTGSYVDNVVFGEMFATGRTLDLGYSPLGSTSPFNSRRLLSSRIGKSTVDFMNNAWLPNYLVNGYASGSFLGRPQRFKRYFSDSEYFFDSFVPNPVETHLASGAELVAFSQLAGTAAESFNEHSGTFYGIRPLENVGLRSGKMNIALTFLVYPAVSDTAYGQVTSSWVDKKWSPSFPMQSRYKNIERLFFFNGELPKTYFVSQSQSGRNISPASASNSIAGISWILSGVLGGYGYLQNLGTMKRPTEGWPQFAGWKLGTAPTREMMNAYFGFGDGFFNPNTAGGWTNGQMFTKGPSVYPSYGGSFDTDTDLICHTIQPRGYKYGLKAPEPEQSSCVWRVGRFGQLRDMLEQRPFSKMRDIHDGVVGTDGPVKFVFLTGSAIYSQSLDYVTATNPSYNPRDSGVWDVEYKSGQPFADMDPVD